MNFSLQGNWVDLVILLVLIYFSIEGVRHGFWIVLADFLSFLGSLLISLRAYQFAATLLRAKFALAHSVSNALGFLITAIVAEGILGFSLGHLVGKLPEKLWKNRLAKIASLIPSLGEGLILIAFVLTLVIGLPIRPSIKKDVADSKIGGFILRQTTGIERAINEVFGGVIEDSLTYLTVKPGSRERVPLATESQELTVDKVAEAEIFRLVNEERRKVGIPELSWEPEIVPVARKHARDMWERSYFGHVSPEGEDVGDRLEKEGISYQFAGENLALAPTVITAHRGLMNSEGHRENVLEREFGRVGIGVIDNGVYGKMFVQVFTD